MQEWQLTKAERDGMHSMRWAMRHFDALTTGRSFPLRIARRLRDKGLIESAGMMAQCDGDGHIIEGRAEREGWRPTDAGRRYLAKLNCDCTCAGPERCTCPCHQRNYR